MAESPGPRKKRHFDLYEEAMHLARRLGKETFAAVAKCPTLFYPPEEFETKSGDIKIKHKQAQKDLEMWPMLQRVVLIKYCVLNVVIFLNSVSSAATLVFDLPLCTHTDTEGKPREARVRNIF